MAEEEFDKDWYETGIRLLMEEAVMNAGVAKTDVYAVYGFLSEVGLIDYDMEKEIIWSRYFGDDEDE